MSVTQVRMFISFAQKTCNICQFSLKYYSKSVRVRFAPSPTGNLHLGGLRTAFYNYLFARKNNGRFILRIEDTDQKRIKSGSLENIHEMLNWVSIIPDESPVFGGPFGPYIQTQRAEIYKEKAKYLLEIGAAYRCFCSEMRLDILRKEALQNRQNPKYDGKCRHLTINEINGYLAQNQPYTIRFKLHEEPIPFDDIVYGKRCDDIFDYEGDFVILKSDGLPTYHFACVVDDHEMEISHVLRGMEWLSSTPKHLMLHKTFGWDPPTFAHLPLLVNSDRTKLSKRQEALSVEYFKKCRFAPLALLNFFAGMGSGFDIQGSCDVFDMNELCDKFDLSKVNTHSCILDLTKLDVYNQNYIRKQLLYESTSQNLIQHFKTILKEELGERFEKNIEYFSDVYIERILNCYKDRITNLNELVQPDMQYLWTLPNISTMKHNLENIDIVEVDKAFIIQSTIQYLKNTSLSNICREELTKILKKHSKEKNVDYAKFMKLLRVVLTGRMSGPGVAEIIEMLGKDLTIKKLETVAAIFHSANNMSSRQTHCI